MMFTILRPDQRAEEMERELAALEAAARVRWRKFWRWLLFAVVCLASFIVGLMIGMPIGRMIP